MKLPPARKADLTAAEVTAAAADVERSRPSWLRSANCYDRESCSSRRRGEDGARWPQKVEKWPRERSLGASL